MSAQKNYFKKRKTWDRFCLRKIQKFQKYDEILCCGMTRVRNVELSVFLDNIQTKTILKKKNMGKNGFKSTLMQI